MSLKQTFHHSSLKQLDKHETDMLVVAVFTDFKLPKWLDESKSIAETEGFSAKSGQIFHTHLSSKKSLVLIGLGEEKSFNLDVSRKAGAWAVKCANDKRAKNVTIVLPKQTKSHIQAASEGAQLALYKFDQYLSEKSETYVKSVTWISEEEKIENALKRAQIIAASVCMARDWVNESPAVMTPVAMAARAQKEAKEHGLEVSVLDEKALEKENMRLLLAVGRAAKDCAPPRLVRLAYRPEKKSKKHIVLVGKGITFDSGGLDIKPADGMLDMKMDMSGAAAVMATMFAIAKLKPSVAVTGYLACAENGISAHAYHPGDVIVSRKGISIEINNTDAEGRLVLSDAIDYAQELDKPDVLIDIATLTGASMIALGNTTASLFSTSDELAKQLRDAGQESGEDFWRMPLNEDLREQLKSSVADMKNSGGRYGGAVTAALFLKKFIKDGVDWAHLDIAGPAFADKEPYYLSKGGVGFGVRTLITFLDGQ